MLRLEECVDSFATPADTTGMGNPSDGSGDMLSVSIKNPFKKQKKKAKSLRYYIKKEMIDK